ncbi:hypothetical protein HPB51_014122 [Rhipicephalus microplus]|uniref:Uncharacterized protein n=1 Tax=Rhipicephalus microplus TaxID=6941 RepID=A0A9J6E0U2_RHIMP|nr:hypothetical protein HPB51_014122 [Rhipicephalus microplus]
MCEKRLETKGRRIYSTAEKVALDDRFRTICSVLCTRPPSQSLNSYGTADDVRSPTGSAGTPGPMPQQPSSQQSTDNNSEAAILAPEQNEEKRPESVQRQTRRLGRELTVTKMVGLFFSEASVKQRPLLFGGKRERRLVAFHVAWILIRMKWSSRTQAPPVGIRRTYTTVLPGLNPAALCVV